jgi:hypothetical protein
MSRKVSLVAAIALMLIVSVVPAGVFAQSATGQTWSTSITYYTPDATGGTLYIHYYAEGTSTPITNPAIALTGNKAGSLFIGGVPGMTSTFKGSAVLEADVPIIATSVGLAQTDPDKNYARPLYTGFDPALASDEFFVPTVLYQRYSYTTTAIGIQNIGDADVNATLKVYAVGSGTPAFEDTYLIKAQSSEIVTASDMAADLGSNFTGSAVVSAPGGMVVAAAQETQDNGRAAKAFEGLPADAGATTIYMASMMCDAWAENQVSYYAIQNVGGSTANVEIDFYDKFGTKVYTKTGLSIDVNNKISENPCKYVGDAPALQGIVGSAVIRSTNSVPLIAMGKVKGGELTETAFVGQSVGNYKAAAPYIRWKADPAQGERSYIAIMNVGDIAAEDIKVHYYDTTGFRQTHVLATTGDSLGKFIKRNSNWYLASGADTDFGVNPYGGAIEVESDQPVIVVVRNQRNYSDGINNFKLAEDYNGVPVP